MWRHQEGGGGGGGTCESWNYPLGPDLEIFPSPPDIFSNGHFPECDVIGGEGGDEGGMYSQILILPSGE